MRLFPIPTGLHGSSFTSLKMPLQVNEPAMYADLSGRTIMVVGTNTGIGLEAAKHFARMGPKRLICTCRTQEKCSQVEEGTSAKLD